MNLNYIIILLCLLLLAFMLFKEFSRVKKVRLVFRILASILVVIALAFLWFPLKYKSSQTIKQNELILITEGASLDSLKAVKAVFYTSDSAVLKEFKSNRVKFLPSLTYHLAANKNINSIKIFGDGLSANDLENLKNYQVNYQKSALPNGFQSCNWPIEIYSGEDLVVQGTYQNNTSKKVKLVLKGLGTNLDSVTIEPEKTAEFNLKIAPKQIGKSVYQLLSLNGKDTLQQENIAFKILEKQALKFLILASTPAFEYKFLKNWLFENGYAVVFRSQISKNIYSFDYLNTPKVEIKQITTQNLKDFDVLIADDEALASLNTSEIGVIQNQVSVKGLGLLIRTLEAKSISNFSKGFAFGAYNNLKIEQLKLKSLKDSFVFSPLQSNQEFYLKENATLKTLVIDDSKHILIGKKINGNGQVVLNTVSSTFQWILNGKTNDYSKFWSGLINQTVKPKEKPYQLAISPIFATQGSILTINLSQSESRIPQLYIAETNLKPLQNKVLPYQWQAQYLPHHSGWHQLLINQKDSVDFYVNKPDAWHSIKQLSKIVTTTNFVKAQKQNDISDKLISNQVENEISKWWFLILFLMSAGYLWYEERMAS